jgi:GNAT superfamily N-acetyltransferase
MTAMTRDGSGMAIRVAGGADLGALADLRALWTAGAGADPVFERRMAAWLADDGERRTTWLATVSDRPAGMASLFEYRRMPKPGQADSRWGYIGNLFVRDDCRRRGLGSALLTAVIAAADERSYERLVVSPSAEALSLFYRHGFVAPGEATGATALLVRPAPHARRDRAR